MASDGASDWFWGIVDLANADRDMLHRILQQQLTGQQIVRFHDEFEEAATELTDPQYTDYMGDDASEDTIKDLAECVVSQGKRFYQDILMNPKKTPNYELCRTMMTFSGVAGSVYAERFGKSLHA